MPKSSGGIDNQGNRLTNVGKPISAADAVRRDFIRYDLCCWCGGLPSASEVLGSYLVPSDLTDGIVVPQNLAGSAARAITAATASSQFLITRIPAGSTTETTIATLTFAASAKLATLSTQASVTLAVGDLLRLKAPSTVDSTLADISFTIDLAR